MKDFYQANTNIQIKKVEWDKKHYLKTTDMFTNDKSANISKENTKYICS